MIDTAAEFQKRRRETWRQIRPWVGIAAAVFTTFVFVVYFGSKLSELSNLNLVFGGMAVAVVAAVRINMVIRRTYRCPECDGVVMDSDGVPVDPAVCPKCGVRLK